MQTLYEVFEHELKDAYDAEQKLVQALEQQANEVADRSVGEAFEHHKEETEGQVERLERIFEILGIEAERHTCHGIDGLLREKQEFSKEDPSIEILQLFNLGAAAKVERYEITAYEGLIALADRLDLDEEVVELLNETLDEEEATLEKVLDLMEETMPAEVEGGEGEVAKATEAAARRGR